MKNFIIVFAFFIGTSTFAQKKWTLQECVAHALENNITVKRGENTLLINDQDIIAAKGRFLPSVNGNVGHRLTLGNAEIFPGQFVDRTANSTSIGVSVNQTIFNGFVNTVLYKQAQINREANELELNRIKDNISLNVVNAYLNVLFNKENFEAAGAQFQFSQKQLKQVKELVDAGVQPRANIFDSEATLATDEQRLTIAENNYTLALLTLSQFLQISFDGFDVEIIEVDSPSEALLYDNVNLILDQAFANRYEIKVAEKNLESAKLLKKVAKGGFLPTVTGGYSFGSNVFFTNLTDTESAFFDQLNNQKSHGFNLNVNIPIFSRFLNRTEVAKAKITEENSIYTLEQTKLDLEANIQRSFTDAQAAFKTFEAAKKSVAAQELALQNAQERYDIGSMNSFDLEQVRIGFINAQTSLINAKYDFVFKTKILDFYMGKSLLN